MQSKKGQKGSAVTPLLKELADREKANRQTIPQQPSVGSTQLEPPALYQDAGGGYNPDFTFPQE